MNKGSVLAIDHGERKTGFAVVDPLRIAPQPLDVFRGSGSGDELLEFISGLLEERTVDTFLVGAPLNMDGTSGPRAAAVDAFVARLAERFPEMKIARYDERLSTKEAEEMLREAGYRGMASRERRDSWSALVVLRDWIRAGEPAEPG